MKLILKKQKRSVVFVLTSYSKELKCIGPSVAIFITWSVWVDGSKSRENVLFVAVK